MRKWILLSFLLAGCGAKRGGETRFLLPWPDALGNYSLQEITLSTLNSPDEVSGPAAEVSSQPTFNSTGFQGPLARPHLSKTGDLYIPQDAESSIALAVYAQYERLMQFEQTISTAAQISWPRRAGIELHLAAPPGEAGGVAHNNAHYFSDLDVTGFLPYTMDQVPLVLNHGILAHEHFHAHFQAMVLRHLSASVGKTISALEAMFYPLMNWASPAGPARPEADEIIKLNNVTLRAWNEGLADFFASTYLNQPSIFTHTLPQVALARALDQPVAELLNAKGLRAEGARRSPDQLIDLAYEQGTKLARLLYALANEGSDPPYQFLQRVMNHLGDLPAVVNPTFTTRLFDTDAIVPTLLGDLKLNKIGCEKIAKAVSHDTLRESFKACVTP